MKGLQKISEKIGAALLRRRKPRKRVRRGYDLKTASRIVILYSDRDESLYRSLREYCKEVKDEFGLKRVKAVAFINATEKEVPIYHAHKLEMEYYTKSDLSWKLRSSQNLRTILNESCDILIDAATGDNLYLDYFVKFSTASMIVGRSGSPREYNYDLTLNLDKSMKTDVFLKETVAILGKMKIQ